MAVDWHSDLERKARNLLRKFIQEVKDAGDDEQLRIDPKVVVNDGAVLIEVLLPPSVTPRAKKGKSKNATARDESSGDG